MSMNPQSPTSPDLMEQAHLALLRGDLGQARSLLDRLVMIEPDNVPAQELRATVVGRQAALTETARLESGDYTGAVQQAQTGSIWTRQIPDPASALLNSPAAQKWPKPLLLVACLLAGVVSLLLPGRHHHGYNHTSWFVDVAFGLAGGIGIFVWMVMRKR